MFKGLFKGRLVHCILNLTFWSYCIFYNDNVTNLQLHGEALDSVFCCEPFKNLLFVTMNDFDDWLPRLYYRYVFLCALIQL